MQVVRKRDASSILYPLAVASTINGGAWTVYGLFGIQDPLVWGPNLAGAMLGVVQLVLRAVYGAGSKGQASSSESTSEYYSGQVCGMRALDTALSMRS